MGRPNGASDRTGYGRNVTVAKREPLSLCEGNSAVYISLGSGDAPISPTGGRPSGPCYVRAAVPGRGPMLRGATAATAAAALALAGCGGSGAPAPEQAATYPVAVAARFPAHQRLAERVRLKIAVRNAGTRTIPNVVATIETGTGPDGTAVQAFGARLDEKGLASHSRPVWVVDAGPHSGDTAYANTWALGSIRPHATRVFTWHVVPVRAGAYKLRYRLAGSTTGRSQLRLRDGGAAAGTLKVHVSGKPAEVQVEQDGTIVPAPS